MCGIAGILSSNKKNITNSALQKMATSFAHRGPNGEHIYSNASQNIGLAHRRLSIIDLTEAGNQPMHFGNRYTIIHNGEIYNYLELKKQLQQQGYTFTTATDTEVIVAAYAKHKENCLQYFDGMFAFAIWDEQEQTLFIARDRFGEKPLYYYYDTEQFCFASEMKALWEIGIPKQINNSMVCLYLGAGFTSIPLEPQITFYQNIYSLPASNYLIVKIEQANVQFKQQQYWDIDKVTTTTLNENDATEKFVELFRNSIKMRLRSDVAIGSSLSGGLDSSSIVATLQQLGNTNLQTFSAIFPGFAKNEEDNINLLKTKYNVVSNFVKPTANDFANDFEKLIAIQEQPFVSSSVYAQYKVFALAKENNTTVLLDGQGADETLAGYTKYLHWYLQELFLYDKKKYSNELQSMQTNAQFSFGIFNKLATWFPGAATTRLEKNVLKQLKTKNYLTPSFVENNFSRLFIHKPLVKKLNDILYFNTMQFGLEELLRYADKNAMANGVEVRLPFLQHELVQFVFSLPSHYKIHNGYTKHILRKAIDKKLPNEIVWNKNKIGYETPQQDWLQQAFFTEKINAAKNKLVTNGILQKKVTNAKTTMEQDWRMMIAVEYL